MQKITNNRVDWIDIAKGFSILSIIVFHTLGGIIYNLVGPLCVPVFFILSGLVAKKQEQAVFIKKKVKSLILPYIAFLFVGLFLTFIVAAWRENFSFKNAFLDLLYANPNAFNISSIWFLVCLFIVSIVCNLIVRLKSAIQYCTVALVSIIGFIYGALYMNKTISFRLPLNIDVALVAILFYMLGYWFKDIIFDFINWFKSKKFIVEFFVMAMFATIWLLTAFINGEVNLHGMRFNCVPIYIISACSSSIFVFLLSAFVEKTVFKGIMTWIGRNSLYIMGIQSVMVRVFILLINHFTDNNFQLYGLPYIYGAVSFVFTSITTLFIVYLYRYIKNLTMDKKSI